MLARSCKCLLCKVVRGACWNMTQPSAGCIYWINALVVEIGLPLREELPKEKRRVIRALAKLLHTNEFDNVKQIEGGVDPSQWIGAGQFQNSDLDIIRGMMRRRWSTCVTALLVLAPFGCTYRNERSRSPVSQTLLARPPVCVRCIVVFVRLYVRCLSIMCHGQAGCACGNCAPDCRVFRTGRA